MKLKDVIEIRKMKKNVFFIIEYGLIRKSFSLYNKLNSTLLQIQVLKRMEKKENRKRENRETVNRKTVKSNFQPNKL
jgi:hypothetical protein